MVHSRCHWYEGGVGGHHDSGGGGGETAAAPHWLGSGRGEGLRFEGQEAEGDGVGPLDLRERPAEQRPAEVPPRLRVIGGTGVCTEKRVESGRELCG